MISRQQLKYKSIFLSNLIQHPKIGPLYQQWLIFNQFFYLKYFIVLGILFSTLLIPFDFLWYKYPFDNPNNFQNIRLMYIASLMPLILLTLKIDFNKRKFSYTASFIMIYISLAFNIKYIIFLYIASDQVRTVVLLANFFVIIASTLFMYRFWAEQYIVSFLSVIFLLNLAYFKPTLQQDAIRLIYFHILSFMVAHYYRNQFLDNLYKKFLYISSMIPMKVAKHFTFTSGRYPLDQIFKSEERFTVCLSSDWRNYQQFSHNMNHYQLSELIEKFYDIIFDKLEEYVPDGQYYADWTADELFIVFYGEEEDKQRTIEKSLKFSNSLATDIYMKIYSELDVDLKYDIGISSGMGFLGLQGPKKFKKTTVTGESAGIAKRLESEAKKIRSESKSSSFPIILMNEQLYQAANKINIFQKHKFGKLSATEKDIKGSKCYSWQFTSE